MTHTFDDEYWDQIWSGERAAAMATSEPNPHLARELSDLEPGTALDAGCGGGAEAIWLASRGWRVIGADIAAAALGHASERADASGVADQVDWVHADLSTWEPGVTFDLVTTHYAHPSMAQLDFYVRLASWVAPGGTLLIVGHLHHGATGHGEPGRGRGGGRGRGHSDHEPPAEASATAAAITARLDVERWEVVTAAETHRVVPGHDVALHDVVVRASRRP